MKIVYVLGTDGAGKTTVSRRLAAELATQGWSYLYCQVTPMIVQPLRWLAGRVFLRRTDQFKNYDAYRAQKRGATGGRRRLTRLYALVWYADFVLQSWLKLLPAWLSGGCVVMDRFYLDMVVNQGVLQENDTAGMLSDARWLECLLPRPDTFIFLDVDEQTAFARKNDIQSVSYLRERKERYLALAPHYRFVMVNANQTPDEVLTAVRALATAAQFSHA